MTLIELLEHCIWILSDGRNLEDCREHLVQAGVHHEVINAIINTLNEDGTYKRTELTTDKYNYRIQVGRDKGAYKTRYSDLTESQAAIYYTGINIGNGYKKRLQESVNGGPWRTLLRAKS